METTQDKIDKLFKETNPEEATKALIAFLEDETAKIKVLYEKYGKEVNGNHFDIFVESLNTEYGPFQYLIEDRNGDNRKIKFRIKYIRNRTGDLQHD